MRARATRAALASGVALAIVYALTMATTVTFWDAGEFLAAFHTLGIPHPPGTPLFVLIGRVATAAAPFAGSAVPGSLLSVLSTAVAGAITAALVARWTSSGLAGVAAALCAGGTATVWLNATETEVYAPSLCLAMLALATADTAGRDMAAPRRWLLLLAYLLGLAVPLHLSALVVAPAAAMLVAGNATGRIDRARLILVGGLAVIVAGAGSVSLTIVGAGIGLVVVSVVVARRGGPGARSSTSVHPWIALGTVGMAALGISAVLVLLVRARLDPALDQGHPATWQALADVVARRQYAVAPLWPRQAPWWLQVANVGQWADWQFGLGLDAGIMPSARRAGTTIAFGALAIAGARWLRRSDVRAWRATLALFVAGSLGVAASLNLKAGPSLGWGVLADDAPHEARERDYFFVLAFWTWGAWAGIGAIHVARTIAARHGVDRRAVAAMGLAIAALPIAINWRAVTRRRLPEAIVPSSLARSLLESAPPRAVLLLIGDNDSYPLWHAQLAEGVRRDVVPVTIPLLGAQWYRAELARRHALLGGDAAAGWAGEVGVLRAVAAGARRAQRPLATSVAVPDSLRRAIGGAWTLRGTVWLWSAALPGTPDMRVDTIATASIARAIDPRALSPARGDGDGVTEWAQRWLRCPAIALAHARATPDASLDGLCNRP